MHNDIRYGFIKMLNVLNALNFSWDLTSWIIPTTIGFITFYLVRFYLSLKDYPAGPMPFPLEGNILSEIRLK